MSWLSAAKPFTTVRVACHGANGEGGVGKPIANSPIATGEVAQHINVLVNGVPGTAMRPLVVS